MKQQNVFQFDKFAFCQLRTNRENMGNLIYFYQKKNVFALSSISKTFWWNFYEIVWNCNIEC